MTDTPLKQRIQIALNALAQPDFSKAALALFDTLGYNTDRRNPFPTKSYQFFKDSFLEGETRFSEEKALTSEWQAVDLLFQLSKDELSGQQGLFDTKQVDNTIIETYLFFAIELSEATYTRTALAQITRELNKVFPMPVMIVFKHGQHVTISVINRRLHKRDAQKDVLEKVTVIKDISLEAPHRAHVEILFDLSLDELRQQHKFTNFVELHQAWQKTLDTKALNKRFYRDLSHWYFWAMHEVTFPGAALEADKQSLLQQSERVREHNAKNLIRLLTRLLFVWFIKEKQLIPDALFDERYIKAQLLADFEPRKKSNVDYKTQGSKYYRAILQNLFFASLNQTVGKREFRRDGQHRNVTNLMRYEAYFKDRQTFLELVEETVPFMNGGLFECLDAPDPTRKGKQGGEVIIYEDGFSDHKDNSLSVPDYIFFGVDEQADLSQELGNKRQKEVAVSGLINILKAYKFTVTENTPIEEDIALDPELLGQVFENLLASYNPETQTTARKQTGSFYTPREIVNYMVDESLIAYLNTNLTGFENLSGLSTEANLRHLLSYNEAPHPFTPAQVTALIAAIDRIKILDPACGSGAFPMGILHKLVHILHKLDPDNAQWREVQRQKALKETEEAFRIGNKQERDDRLQAISDVFERNADDYGRKLYLIENCIYGVDIQPIATQISKLRFFISLIVDQQSDSARDNFGIRPLPNLETKFVAANTLLGIEKPALQLSLFDTQDVKAVEEKLKEVRHSLFNAKTPARKRKLRAEDKSLREKMGDLLIAHGWGNETARQLAAWDPYDQNATSPFFDPEWMFGLSGGFDVVIGNPPYVRMERIKELKPALKKNYPDVYEGRADIYVYFFRRSVDILREGGMLTFITSNKYFRARYGQKLRQFFGENITLHQLIDFGDTPVFTAIAYPNIIILEKRPPHQSTLQAMTWEPGPAIADFPQIFTANSFPIAQSALTADGWRLEPPAVLNLLKKLSKVGTPLGKYMNDKFYMGIKTGYNEAFIIDRVTRDRLIAVHPFSEEIIKPYLRGRDIKRWRVDFADLYLIFTNRDIAIDRYPAIKNHLMQYKDQLEKRATSHLHPWYELQQPQTGIHEEFDHPKIVYQEIATYQVFAWDTSGAYSNNKIYFIPNAGYYLLGLLNSKVVWFFLNNIVSKLSGGAFALQTIYVSQIPIPTATESQKTAIESLVTQILAAKAANPAANTTALEAEIDQLVYQLYGLTAEEIAIVEGRTG